MSPTVFKEGKYRFHFFSREEDRVHIHVVSPDGEAKFWLEPTISLANHSGLSKKDLNFYKKQLRSTKMKSLENGKSISNPEITNIPEHGFWILLDKKEYFLPFTKYPWFKDARISSLINVELIHGHHFHWPELDVDLSIEILDNPEKYPLSYT